MSLEKFRKVIGDFVPSSSLDLVLSLIEKKPFHLRITEPRKTKKGDFRPSLKKDAYHKISVNGDLNTYEFLVTLIHEYAHLITWDAFGRKVKPHGEEWKSNFASLLQPFIELKCFPDELEHALRGHMKSVKAASCVDIKLQKVFRMYDDGPQKLTVEELPENSVFLYSKDRLFKKGPRLRKRYKCESLADGRMYLFSPLAEVELSEAE
ncbi:MAG: SprT-like domain-containing protein [Saprospiraceae bacterium]